VHFWDLLVIGLYGLTVIAIGAAANRKQKNTEDYYLGGRGLPWWAVGISILATSFSSASLIGGTGAGYASGMKMIQWQIGDLLAFSIVCVFFLPYFARLRLTTAYEFLEHRFGRAARLVASGLFLLQTVLRTGLLVYAPALALSTVLGWSIETAISLTALCAILYSSFGGISAVIWTDLIQVGVIGVGVVASLFLIAGDVPGGFDTILETARNANRMQAVDLSFDWKNPFTLGWTVLAYGVLALSIAGTNQQAVQRYQSCRDLASSRKAALFGWGIGALVLGATLFLGVCLHAWTTLVPDALPDPVKGDQVLPALILHRLPPGLAGLLVAAIFAASMSSIDSAIHSMSTATLIDFVRPHLRQPLTESAELRWARVLTALFGLIALGVALVAAQQEQGLFQTMVKWLGYFAGPLLGLFLLGIVTRRASQPGALLGVGLSFLGVIGSIVLELPAEYGFHPLWLAPVALGITLLVGRGFAPLPADRAWPGLPESRPDSDQSR
jgi:SSS family solute:Na+ symporter